MRNKEPQYSDRISKNCEDLTPEEKAGLTSKITRFGLHNWFNLPNSGKVTARENEMINVTNVYLTPEDIVVEYIEHYIPEKNGFPGGNLNNLSIYMYSNKNPVDSLKKTLLDFIDNK